MTLKGAKRVGAESNLLEEFSRIPLLQILMVGVGKIRAWWISGVAQPTQHRTRAGHPVT